MALKSNNWPVFAPVWSHRTLILELTKRDIEGRYRGAALGLVWSFLSPIMMLLVYILSFGGIMKARWPDAPPTMAAFALIIFVGLVIHGALAECLTKAPHVLTSNVGYVKKLIFPLQILPWPMVLSAMFHLAANLMVFFVFQLALERTIYPTAFWLPLILFPLMLFAVGVSWLVAALSVYFRDIGQIVGPLSTAMLFLSSAIIPVSSIPPNLRLLFQLNPTTFAIDQARAVTLWGHAPDFMGLLVYYIVALAVAYLGSFTFAVLKRGFADVL